MRRQWPLRLRIALAVAIVVMMAALAALLLVSVELADLAAGQPMDPMAIEYRELLALLAPFAVAAPIAAWAVARWALAPLDRLADAARRIGPAEPALRLARDGLPSEVAPLVEAVNGALDRLSEALLREQRGTAEAAHALRTPLAVLDLKLQRAVDAGQVAPDVYRAELERLKRTVAQLLSLARREAGEAGQPEPVAVARTVRGVAAALLPRAEAAGRRIVVEAAAEPVITSDAAALEELVTTLADNALVHGAGVVRLGVDADGLWVADDGPGPPAAVRDLSFDRFVRGPASPGSGLGLAVARSTARAMGATLDWQQGSRIMLRWADRPAVQPTATTTAQIH